MAKDNLETCPSIKDNIFKLRGEKMDYLMNGMRHNWLSICKKARLASYIKTKSQKIKQPKFYHNENSSRK